MVHPPGEVFNYNNGNPDLVSAIITRLTDRLAEDYARERLFEPLGIADWHWDRDPQDLTTGEGSCICCRATWRNRLFVFASWRMGGKTPFAAGLGGCSKPHDREYACVPRSQPKRFEFFLDVSRQTRLHVEWQERPVHLSISRSRYRGGNHLKKTNQWRT